MLIDGFIGCWLLTFLYYGTFLLRPAHCFCFLQADRIMLQATGCVSDARLAMRRVFFRYNADVLSRRMLLCGSYLFVWGILRNRHYVGTLLSLRQKYLIAGPNTRGGWGDLRRMSPGVILTRKAPISYNRLAPRY